MASLSGKLALLRGLLDGQTAYRGPFFVAVDTTRRCNNVCLGCFYHCRESGHAVEGDQSIQELPLDLARSMARDLARSGVKEVVMAGEGEPLLHSRFIDVLAAFKEPGLRVQVFTNGILLDDNMAHRMVSAGVDDLHVSFWAVTPEEHSRWHPGMNPGALQQRIRGAAAVTQAKKAAQSRFPKLTLQVLVNRENLPGLSTRADLALEIGCDSVQFAYFRHYGSSFEGLSLGPEDEETAAREFGLAARRLDAAGIRHDAGKFLARLRMGNSWLRTPCYAPWYTCHIRVDGNVHSCPRCEFAMGSLRERTFAEIWNGARFKEFRRRCGSRTPEAGLGCACENCCVIENNQEVHNVFRWFKPVARRWPEPDRARSLLADSDQPLP
jgi:cyclic pyranopterin phosphate synthase